MVLIPVPEEQPWQPSLADVVKECKLHIDAFIFWKNLDKQTGLVLYILN